VIVDPDFLDHWRTRMVVDALGGDELAPMYILRLWAHCQARKSDRHAMPPAGLKAQCRAPHDAAMFEQALTDAGFVQREDGCLHVLGWAEQNASLLAAWENGAKGGRPRKPNPNPQVPEVPHLGDSEKPTENPAVTQTEPKPNPDETDKRREEKNSPSPNGEGSGFAPRASPPTPPPPPDFDGKNSQALNGKAIVPIAVGWELPEQWGVDAEALGWKPAQVVRESEKFRQYWTAGRGQGTRRSVKGWRQAWSNWLEKAAKDQR
jgi:hypothetical protein